MARLKTFQIFSRRIMMKHTRALPLLCPAAAVILALLPGGAVLNFGQPDGEPIRETFSYFSLTPFGYANFSPFLSALATCAMLLLLSLYCFFNKEKVFKTVKVTAAIAFVLSLCPLLLGVAYYSVIGGLITIALGAELLFLLAFEKKIA
jgi:hypothetical protein